MLHRLDICLCKNAVIFSLGILHCFTLLFCIVELCIKSLPVFCICSLMFYPSSFRISSCVHFLTLSRNFILACIVFIRFMVVVHFSLSYLNSSSYSFLNLNFCIHSYFAYLHVYIPYLLLLMAIVYGKASTHTVQDCMGQILWEAGQN